MEFDDSDRHPPGTGPPGLVADLGAAAISMIPVFGGPAVIALQRLVGPVVNRRREEWFTGVYDDLRLLEEKVGRLATDLAQDPEFVDALLQAGRSAMSTASREKRESLRNAVLNVAAGQTPGGDIQQMLFRYVDELTPTHLRILGLISEKGRHCQVSRTAEEEARPLADYISLEMPELSAGDSLADVFCADLVRRGLLLDVPRGGGLLRTPMALLETTGLGGQFLELVKSPVR
jgi:hypothetical protein